jgi:hypothetical protein
MNNEMKENRLHPVTVAVKRIVTDVDVEIPTEMVEGVVEARGNAIPLIVREIGTPINPQYELAYPDDRQQQMVLAAVRGAREIDLRGCEFANVILLTDAIAKQMVIATEEEPQKAKPGQSRLVDAYRQADWVGKETILMQLTDSQRELLKSLA